MARDSRTIISLKREKEVVERKLNDAEIFLGHQLFQSTTTSLITKAERSRYYSYVDKNTQIQADIAEIKALVGKLKDTNKAESESHDAESALIGQWSVWYRTLGKTMYRHYTPLFENVFGMYYVKAQVQKDKLDEAEKAANDLKQTMNEQGFFSKLFSQVKYVSANNMVSSYQNRFNLFLEKGGKAAYSSEEFASVLEHDEIEEVVRRAYKSCVKLDNDIHTEHAKGVQIREVCDEIRSSLNDLSASGFGDRRIQELQHETLVNEDEKNEYAGTKAHEIVNQYVDENGLAIKDFPEDFGEAFIRIINLRKECLSGERRVKIQLLQENIAAATKELSSNSKKISSNIRKIENLTKQNSDLQSKNEILSNQKKEWESLKIALDLAEATNIKHLKDVPQNMKNAESHE